MHVERFIRAVSDDLANLAAVGDETTARAAGRLTVALEASLGRRLQEALSEAALELSGQLDHGRVDVRIAGGDPELVYVDESGPVTEPGLADGADAVLSARITLRLPETLKTRVETAAATNGVSVNTWIVQALTRLSEARRTTATSGGRRLSGYARS